MCKPNKNNKHRLLIHTKFWYNAENTPICYAFDTPDMLLFYRFQSVYDLLEGNLLANPAQADENGAYVYDANATAMIKNELVSGRAVTFGFLADQAQPGQELSPNSLLSFRDENGQKTDMNSAAIWAQYTYDKTYDPSDPGSVNHKVFNINHAEDFDDETEFELNVTIGADNTGISRTAAGLKAGENRTFDYTYTVTAADAKAGKVESTLKIKCNGEEVEYNPVFGDILSFTVTTVDSYIIGDANGDGVVDINDATAIQKAVAEIPLDFFDEKAADVDFNGLSVEDATNIQKYLVEYNTPYRIGETAEAGKSRTGFSDVAVGSCYEDAVDWGVDNGIAQGISDDLFGVGQALTVADMDKMLRRTAGLPDSEETSAQTVDRLTAVTAIWNQFANGETAECPFTDVTENAGAVGWAYKKGIIGGEPGSAFSPDKTEMREEFITMLYRWRWQSDGYIDRTVGVFREKLTDETAKVRYFSDARSIAYMSIADYYSIMLPGYTMKVTAEGSGKYKLTNACGSAVADVEKDTFH